MNMITCTAIVCCNLQICMEVNLGFTDPSWVSGLLSVRQGNSEIQQESVNPLFTDIAVSGVFIL